VARDLIEQEVQSRINTGGKTSELAMQTREDDAANANRLRTQESAAKLRVESRVREKRAKAASQTEGGGGEEVRPPAAKGDSLRQLAEASGVDERALLGYDAHALMELCTQHGVDNIGAVVGEWNARKEAAAVAAAGGSGSTWAQRMFWRIDRDNDGLLTKQDLAYALQWLGATDGRLNAESVLHQLDTDGNGRVDEQEWEKGMSSCEGLEEALLAGEVRDKEQHVVHANATKPNANFRAKTGEASKSEVWLDYQMDEKPNDSDTRVTGKLMTDGTVTHTRTERTGKKQLVVQLRGNRMIEEVKSEVNLLCVFGGARSGKSTIMSILGGRELFETSDQLDSFTMGIHVGNHFMQLQDFCGLYGGRSPLDPESRQPLVTQDGNYPLVGFVDAEGQGDQTSHDYDIKLIAGPMLLSKVIIFNVGAAQGVLVNETLEKLELLTKVAKRYCQADVLQKGVAPFGFLHIVKRDCKPGAMRQGVEYYKRQLLDDEEGSQFNATRKSLRDSFRGIDCHLLPECSPWPPDPLLFEELSEPGQVGFHDYVQELRRDVAAQLVEPHTVPSSEGGHEVLRGPNLAAKMELIAKSITEDKVFVMSALDAMDENARLKAANEALKKAQELLAEEQEQLQKEMQRVAEEKKSVEKDQALLGDTLPLVRALTELLEMDAEKAKQLAKKLAATPDHLSRLASGDDDEQVAVICELFKHAEHAAQAHIRLALESRIVAELTQTLNIEESLATQLVAAMALGIDSPQAVVDCLREPSRILSLLTQWANSPACGDRALDIISLALRTMLAEKAETIKREKIKKEVLTAIGSLEITQPQVVMLMEGQIDALLKDLLGKAASQCLDDLAPGLQQKAERATEIAVRVEMAAAKVDSATSGLASEMFESLLQAGKQLPGIGPVIGLMGGVYKAAKGAVLNKPACAKFGHFVQRKERLVRRAMGAPNVEESVAEVQRVLTEAKAFLETMQEGKGFFRRMLSSASDANKLKDLTADLNTAMNELQQNLAVEGALAMHELTESRIAAQEVSVSEQQEATSLAKLRSRVEAKVGCNAEGEPMLERLRGEDIAGLVEDLPFDAQELQAELAAHLAEIKADTEKLLAGQDEIQARQQEAAAVEQKHHDEILDMLESMKTTMAPVATAKDIESAVAQQLQNRDFVARLELLPEEQRERLRQRAQQDLQDFMEEAQQTQQAQKQEEAQETAAAAAAAVVAPEPAPAPAPAAATAAQAQAMLAPAPAHKWVDGQHIDREALVAQRARVKVDGHGEGIVQAFNKATFCAALVCFFVLACRRCVLTALCWPALLAVALAAR
jgi:hypothetical protein